MKCIIIDDEKTARMALTKLCETSGLLEVIGEFENPTLALPFINQNTIDLIFLDIHMPELKGSDFLKTMSTLPDVIMTTTDTSFALEAFEHNVIDYLVKPIDMPRFLKSVEKIKSSKKVNEGDTEATSMFVNINSRLIKIDFEYCTSNLL